MSLSQLAPPGTRDSAEAAGKALQAWLSLLDPFSRCLLLSRVVKMGCRHSDGSLSWAVQSWEGPRGPQAPEGAQASMAQASTDPETLCSGGGVSEEGR